MAFAVRKFPDSNDPRGTAFCVKGFAWGAVPAYRYLMSTTGASGVYSLLNSGVVVLFGGEIPPVHYWLRSNDLVLPFSSSLEIYGYEELQSSPVDHTIRWRIQFSAPGEATHVGNDYAEFPNAITGWPTITVSPIGPGSLLIPNPVLVTPCIYDHPITP